MNFYTIRENILYNKNHLSGFLILFIMTNVVTLPTKKYVCAQNKAFKIRKFICLKCTHSCILNMHMHFLFVSAFSYCRYITLKICILHNQQRQNPNHDHEIWKIITTFFFKYFQIFTCRTASSNCFQEKKCIYFHEFHHGREKRQNDIVSRKRPHKTITLFTMPTRLTLAPNCIKFVTHSVPTRILAGNLIATRIFYHDNSHIS